MCSELGAHLGAADEDLELVHLDVCG